MTIGTFNCEHCGAKVNVKVENSKKQRCYYNCHAEIEGKACTVQGPRWPMTTSQRMREMSEQHEDKTGKLPHFEQVNFHSIIVKKDKAIEQETEKPDPAKIDTENGGDTPDRAEREDTGLWG
tara:strand:- start:7712 stop:8077 length:366 start_codon:yes stop_codon:yes gene_type:complete